MKTLRTLWMLSFITLLANVGQASTLQDAEVAMKTKDFQRAFKLYERAARDGDATAQYRLGNAYINGGIAKKDPRQAAEWYAKAAKQSYAPAETMLGRLALKRKDYRAAMAWFDAAAAKGHAEAEDYLGYFHLFGRGVPKDPVKAAKLFSSAAKKGNPDAEYEYGILLLNGTGVAKDARLGLQWIRAAASAGDPSAKRFLTSLSKRGQPRGFVATHKRSMILGGLLALAIAGIAAFLYLGRKGGSAFRRAATA